MLWADVQKKPIRLTKHASDRAIKYDLDSEAIKRIIEEGEKQEEGKEKVKYVLRSKRGVYVAICIESPEQIVIITLTKGK
jgi:glutamine phosphoribosylpyrophosphate amidotransferase